MDSPINEINFKNIPQQNIMVVTSRKLALKWAYPLCGKSLLVIRKKIKNNLPLKIF